MPTHNAEDAEVSITRLHLLTGKARETITKRLEGRLQPLRRDGRTIYYDPQAALPLIYLLEEGLDPAQERAHLDRAKREGQEMLNAVKRGELVSAEAVVTTWATKIVTIKSRLRALPAQAAARIPGVTPAITKRLIELVARALSDLADDAGSSDTREPLEPRS